MNFFTISLDNNQRLVIIKAEGVLHQSDGEKIITEARTAAAENDFDIIYDMRQATTKVNFASWFHLPRKLEVFKDVKAHSIKAAILVSEKDKALKEYNFYQTVTQNLGFNIKIFLSEDEALEWLKRESMEDQ